MRTQKIKRTLVFCFLKKYLHTAVRSVHVIMPEHQVVMLGLPPKEATQGETISEDGVRLRIFGVELTRRWKEQRR